MDGTVLKAFVTLVGCIAFLGVVLWWVKRKTSRGQAGNQDLRIRIVARQTLSSKASVAVVEVGEKTYVLGVTEHSVTNLGTTVNEGHLETSARAVESQRTAPTFGPPRTYPPTAPPPPFSFPGTFTPPDTIQTSAPDLSVRGYFRTLFRRQ